MFVSTSFAQPRDLFAEFEAEETAAEQAKADSVKAAEEMAAAEKKAAEEKAEADRMAAEKAAAEKAAAEQAAADAEAERLAREAAEEKRRNMEMATQAAMNSDSAKAADDAAAAAAENKNIDANEAYARAIQAYADSARIRDDLEAIARDSAAVAQMIADSVAAAEKAKADSIAAAMSSSSVSDAPSSSSMSRRDLLGPVKVSKVNGIDEMRGKYRSPRKAMFMSLIIPGSGQMYVGGSSFNYVRGGVYLALEAALWSGWYYYSVYKYNDQVRDYKKFAKKHYSIGRYERKMRDLYDQDAVNYETEFRRRYLGTRESFCDGIYNNASDRGCYNRDKLYTNDGQFKSDFVTTPVSLGEEIEQVDGFDDASAVYQQIADKAYVLGWDDVTDEAVATNLGLENPESATEVLGASDNMKKYRSIRSKANDYADMQAWFFGGLILNHIVSAVDAALSASSFNKTLYQEDLSWYDRLHFDSGLQLFGGFGVNVQASWGF